MKLILILNKETNQEPIHPEEDAPASFSAVAEKHSDCGTDCTSPRFFGA